MRFSSASGAEPPLDVRGERRGESARRVSLRWLAGSGLTGLIGAGLLGGAIYAAFDREANFAEAPTRALLNRKDQGESEKVNPAKGDRLIKSVDIVAAKQTYKTPTAIRVGDHEVIKNRTFTRVSTTLTLADTGLGADVPEFNPLKLLADSSNPAPEAPEPAPAPDVAEVSFTVADLSTIQFNAPNGALSLDEVRAQVAETLKHAQTSGSKASPTLPPQLLLMRTSRASFDANGPGLAYATPGNINVSSPFSSIEVRMVPENVTLAPRTTNPVGDSDAMRDARDKLVIIRRGEGLDDVLTAAGVQKSTIAAVKDAFNSRRANDAISEGRRVKLSFAETEGAATLQLARLTVYDEEKIKASVALADSGRYLLLENAQAADANAKARKAQQSDDERRRRFRRDAALQLTLRNRPQAGPSPPDHRSDGPHLRERRRFPASGRRRRLHRCIFRQWRGWRPRRVALRVDHGAGRDLPILPVSIHGRPGRRLFRPLRQINPQVPGAKAHRLGRTPLRFRHALPSDPPLHPSA